MSSLPPDSPLLRLLGPFVYHPIDLLYLGDRESSVAESSFPFSIISQLLYLPDILSFGDVDLYNQ